MGCQSRVMLGSNLTFTITTHDPDTGVLTDADSAPAYRVYEDETATAILTGTMATLDTANTTGFYSEQIACSTANGFEVDKSYSVYVETTVDGDKGGISYGFTVESTVVLADGGITAAKIATDAITAAKIAADAIGASELATDAVAAIAAAVHLAGAGAITFTYTLTLAADSSAIADADVWVTSDEAGNTLVASGETDENGQVVFYLDAGTYYVWRQKAGYNFTNPDTETVS